MPLHLERPIIVIDLETTGTDVVKDRIVEIAVLKIFPTQEQKIKRKLINPGIPISAEASEIHGITNEMVSNAPSFKDIANELRQFMEGSDIVGFNSNRFDIPMLVEEFLRCEVDFDLAKIKMIDAQTIFHREEPRTLSAAYKFYCNSIHEQAHSAEADVKATWEVFCAQVERYQQVGSTVEDISKYLNEKPIVDFAKRLKMEKEVCLFNFGKHKDKPVTQVFKEEPQYFDWMMKSDFSLHTKKKLSELYNAFKLGKKLA